MYFPTVKSTDDHHFMTLAYGNYLYSLLASVVSYLGYD